jgi:YfiH family protein
MVLEGHNGLSFWQFDIFKEFSGLRHGTFTRHGGCSAAPFDSLNVAFGIGDNPANIRRNRGRIERAMNLERSIYLDQVHGSGCYIHDATQGQPQPPQADAVITARHDHLLVIQTADCQAVQVFDPRQKVVANVHAGWRGSAANVIGRTVTLMVRHFGCDPTDLLAAIGPSLGPCCGEFVNYRRELPRRLWAYRRDKDYFDFWAISCDQLQAAGLRPGHIEVSRICTRCRTDVCFSYRAEQRTGRMAAVIGMAGL